MSDRVWRDRGGASTGDVLIFLATLCIGAALLYPAWSVRDFRQRVNAAVADVETLGSAARSVRDDTGRWPSSSDPGEAPPELSSLAESGMFERTNYLLSWSRWEVVDSVPAPPSTDPIDPGDAPSVDASAMLPVVRSVGAITLRSAEQSLLAELLERYAEQSAFVVDSMWVLVLPERGDAG